MALPTFTIQTGGSRMGDIGSSFAYDLARRISQSKGLDAVQQTEPSAVDPAQLSGQEAAQAEKAGQLEKLEKALAGTVSYMAEKHGEKAASTMVGLVYKRLGDGEINEQTLGNAFLDVTRFIDANFGTGAGDAFLSHLNGSLNETMNAFFDNGLNETFMVAPSSGGGSAGVEGLLGEITKQYADAIKEMLEEARANAENGQGFAAAYTDPAQQPLIGVMKDVVV